MRPSRIAYIFAAVLLLLASGQYIRARAPKPAEDMTIEIPKIVQSGLESYKSEGPEAAVRSWLKGGPLEGNKDAFNILRQAQDAYGSYRGFDVVRYQDLSASVRIVYLTLNYDKGPVFARFISYKSPQGSILTALDISTKPEQILPNILQ
jgi:hypothetical protein